MPACTPQIKWVTECVCGGGGGLVCTSIRLRSHLNLRGDTLHSVYATCHAMPRQSGHFCFCSALLRVFKGRPQSDRCHSRCQIATYCFPWPVYSLAVLPARYFFDIRQPINRCAINSPLYRGKCATSRAYVELFSPPPPLFLLPVWIVRL